jgi:hypothetical protein
MSFQFQCTWCGTGAMTILLLAVRTPCDARFGKCVRTGSGRTPARMTGGRWFTTFSPSNPNILLWAAVGRPSPVLNRPSECTNTTRSPASTVKNPIQSEEFKMLVRIRLQVQLHVVTHLLRSRRCCLGGPKLGVGARVGRLWQPRCSRHCCTCLSILFSSNFRWQFHSRVC